MPLAQILAELRNAMAVETNSCVKRSIIEAIHSIEISVFEASLPEEETDY